MVAIISNDSMSDYTKMPFSQVTNYIIQNLTVGVVIIFLISDVHRVRTLRF
jgi:hypothetical protein